jgi:5,10-methylenetetrahydromethanopterin reductase
MDLAGQVDSEPRYGSFWIAEITHARSAIPLLAVCALRTKRVRLGLGILGSHTRHPAITAMEAATLSEISRKRLILGLGSARTAAMRHNWRRGNLATMQDSLAIIKPLLNGQTVNYAGPVFEAKSLELDMKTEGIPLYIGTYPSSTRMLQLAGALADGIILMWATPLGVTRAVDIIRGAANQTTIKSAQ